MAKKQTKTRARIERPKLPTLGADEVMRMQARFSPEEMSEGHIMSLSEREVYALLLTRSRLNSARIALANHIQYRDRMQKQKPKPSEVELRRADFMGVIEILRAAGFKLPIR